MNVVAIAGVLDLERKVQSPNDHVGEKKKKQRWCFCAWVFFSMILGIVALL